MKSIIFALMFFSTTTVLACPNLAGTFRTQMGTGFATIVATQVECQSINFLVTVVPAGGPASTLNYAIVTDGLLRKVQSAPGVDEYMAMKFEGDHLDSVAIWVQNGVGSPVVNSSTDIFSLDSTSNLVDYTVSVNNSTGASSSNQITYMRVSGESLH